MSQFQENLQTDGRMDPILQDPSGQGWGSKNATSVDKLDFAKKTDFANLKSNVDKLVIDKF